MKSFMFSAMIAATAAFHIPVVAQAQTAVSAEEATRKVNVAGRQRMLSQRMAKAACLMAQDIGYEVAFNQMTGAYNLFITSDNALRNGNTEFGLQAETFPRVIGALNNIDEHWLRYRLVIEDAIETATVSAEDLGVLDEASLQVLKFMNIAVFQTARAYADVSPDLPLGQTITVDLAGRQRMLTQRATKEACMMRIADDPSVYAARLAETVELFDLSLTALQVGFEQVGVIPAPTPALEQKLADVRDLWGPVKEIMDRAAAGTVLSDAEMAELAQITEPLLVTMNEAVGLYEDIPQN